jgi:hypothetical protein
LRPITRAVENVHRGEHSRRAVPFIIMRHGSGATFLQRQSGLGAVERLNLALFVDRQDDGVCGRIDMEPDDIAQFVDEARVVGGSLDSLNWRIRCGCRPRASCVEPNSR